VSSFGVFAPFFLAPAFHIIAPVGSSSQVDGDCHCLHPPLRAFAAFENATPVEAAAP
jgi:hypothetical protein